MIGAGRERGRIGHDLRNLLDGDFAGPVYPVHPTAAHIASVRAYPTVVDVPDDVDVAVIVVPADRSSTSSISPRRNGCGAWSSSPPAADRPEGAEAERELVWRARAHGMRMVGPNCMAL